MKEALIASAIAYWLSVEDKRFRAYEGRGSDGRKVRTEVVE